MPLPSVRGGQGHGGMMVKENVFVKPNDQSKVYFSYGMARKGRMKSNVQSLVNSFISSRVMVPEIFMMLRASLLMVSRANSLLPLLSGRW